MASTYKALTDRIEALQARADIARRKEAAQVIKQVRATIAEYGLTADDLGLTQSNATRSSAPMRDTAKKTPPASSAIGRPQGTVKYRDDQGNAWSGRGPKPAWLKTAIAAGKALEDYRVGGAGEGPALEAKAGQRRAKLTKRVKWKDDAGHTWSGRGVKPAWFKAAREAGKTLEELAA